MDQVLRLERVIDLPLAIVWDALVDADLVEGWLDPVARLVQGTRVRERRDPGDGGAALRIHSFLLGEVGVELESLPGGTRSSVTRLRLDVTRPGDPAALAAEWQGRLDRLENLLRGHPAVWHESAPDSGADSRLLR